MPRGVNTQDEGRIQGRNVVNANSSNIVAPGIVTDGLVLHLDAGNYNSYPIAGTSWYDLSGNRNNGTLFNGPTYSGGVISFDGTNDYMQADVNSTILDGDPSFSVDMFVRRRTGTNIGGGAGFWGIGGVGTGNSAEGYTAVANSIRLDFYNSARIVSSDSYPEGSFVHIIWTKNGTGIETTNIKCFVNGIESATTKAGTTQPNNFNTSSPGKGIALGRLVGDDAFGVCPIDVAVFKVYSRALTPSEAQQNFNALRARFNI